MFANYLRLCSRWNFCNRSTLRENIPQYMMCYFFWDTLYIDIVSSLFKNRRWMEYTRPISIYKFLLQINNEFPVSDDFKVLISVLSKYSSNKLLGRNADLQAVPCGSDSSPCKATCPAPVETRSVCWLFPSSSSTCWTYISSCWSRVSSAASWNMP